MSGSGLSGRRVLVVGADDDIRRSTLARLAPEDADVSVIDDDEAPARSLTTDGPPDALIRCPPARSAATVLDTSADSFRSLWRRGVKAPFFLLQRYVRALEGRSGAACVAAPLVGSQRPGVWTPRDTIEGAVAAMTHLLAVELAPLQVRLNALCPIEEGSDPDAAADAFVFLVSDAASYMTGACIPVLARSG